MPSDRQIIESEKAYLRRQYRGDILTVGPLVVGKVYQINSYVSGDDFRNVGAVPGPGNSWCFGGNGSGQIFTATGTTPTDWTHGSALFEWKLQELLELAATFYDSSPGDVTLTSTSFEGGSASGQLTNRRQLRLVAIEELIAEIDPGYTVPQARASGSLLLFEP